MTTWVLKRVGEELEKLKLYLKHGDNVVGRDKPNIDIELKSPYTSQIHCVITVTNNEVHITDTSRNGIFLNRMKIKSGERCEVKMSDSIGFGSFYNPDREDSYALFEYALQKEEIPEINLEDSESDIENSETDLVESEDDIDGLLNDIKENPWNSEVLKNGTTSDDEIVFVECKESIADTVVVKKCSVEIERINVTDNEVILSSGDRVIKSAENSKANEKQNNGHISPIAGTSKDAKKFMQAAEKLKPMEMQNNDKISAENSKTKEIKNHDRISPVAGTLKDAKKLNSSAEKLKPKEMQNNGRFSPIAGTSKDAEKFNINKSVAASISSGQSKKLLENEKGSKKSPIAARTEIERVKPKESVLNTRRISRSSSNEKPAAELKINKSSEKKEHPKVSNKVISNNKMTHGNSSTIDSNRLAEEDVVGTSKSTDAFAKRQTAKRDPLSHRKKEMKLAEHVQSFLDQEWYFEQPSEDPQKKAYTENRNTESNQHRRGSIDSREPKKTEATSFEKLRKRRNSVQDQGLRKTILLNPSGILKKRRNSTNKVPDSILLEERKKKLKELAVKKQPEKQPISTMVRENVTSKDRPGKSGEMQKKGAIMINPLPLLKRKPNALPANKKANLTTDKVPSEPDKIETVQENVRIPPKLSFTPLEKRMKRVQHIPKDDCEVGESIPGPSTSKVGNPVIRKNSMESDRSKYAGKRISDLPTLGLEAKRRKLSTEKNSNSDDIPTLSQCDLVSKIVNNMSSSRAESNTSNATPNILETEKFQKPSTPVFSFNRAASPKTPENFTSFETFRLERAQGRKPTIPFLNSSFEIDEDDIEETPGPSNIVVVSSPSVPLKSILKKPNTPKSNKKLSFNFENNEKLIYEKYSDFDCMFEETREILKSMYDMSVELVSWLPQDLDRCRTIEIPRINIDKQLQIRKCQLEYEDLNTFKSILKPLMKLELFANIYARYRQDKNKKLVVNVANVVQDEKEYVLSVKSQGSSQALSNGVLVVGSRNDNFSSRESFFALIKDSSFSRINDEMNFRLHTLDCDGRLGYLKDVKTIKILVLGYVKNELKNLVCLEALKNIEIMSKILKPKANNAFESPITNYTGTDTVNQNQKNLIMGIAEDFLDNRTTANVFAIEGGPGTGKTRVIVNVIGEIFKNCERKPKVLVCSVSNACINEITYALLQKRSEIGYSLVRTGTADKISEEIREVSIHQLIKEKVNFNASVLAVKKEIVDLTDIVCTTINSTYEISDLVETRKYELCIIDEATQCSDAQLVIPLNVEFKKLVLIGDTKQLGGMIQSQVVKECNLDLSLFKRIVDSFDSGDERAPIYKMVYQYRMHPEILKWPNAEFYNNSLRTGLTFSDQLLNPYVLFDIDSDQNMTQEIQRNIYNREEIGLVEKLIELILKIKGTEKMSFGIITPYLRQKKELSNKLKHFTVNGIDIKEYTIDSAQGMEKDIVIITTARTDGVGFLKNPQRLNVALTRAKRALYICGNLNFLSNSIPLWKKLINDAKERKRFHTVTEYNLDGIIENAIHLNTKK